MNSVPRGCPPPVYDPGLGLVGRGATGSTRNPDRRTIRASGARATYGGHVAALGEPLATPDVCTVPTYANVGRRSKSCMYGPNLNIRYECRSPGSTAAQHGHDGVGRRGLARGARRARSEAAPGPLSARRDGGLFFREKIPWIPEVLKVSGTAEHKIKD